MEPRRFKAKERVLTSTLDNGMRVVLVPDKRTNLVMVGVHYSVGAADDPRDGEGLAHYVEHVMFDAGYHGPAGNALRDVGLYKNAFTSFDRTFFHLTALDVELEAALEIAARRFEARCDDFDPATLARERDVVIEESKLRSEDHSMFTGFFRAIWGADHPYARSPGSHRFADLPRPTLCKFIEDHYGPGSAVLVVTGNVRDDVMQRIAGRFGKIPARPAPKRVVRTAPIQTQRIVVRELAHPTALVAFAAPGEGTDADASIDALDGRVWGLSGRTPAESAITLVVGEERERAIVAIAEVKDAKQLDELAAAMIRTFEKPKFDDFATYKQWAKAREAARLDDTFEVGARLAAVVARGERPSRFRDLEQIDQLSEEQVTRWFDAPTIRVAFLLPEVGVTGTQHVANVATSLHELEVPRSPASGVEPPPPPRAQRPLVVSEHRLSNGLRVMFAPDPDAVAVDARLVIAGTRDERVSSVDEQAARFLGPNPKDLTVSLNERLSWYANVAAPVDTVVGDQTTTFQIRGLGLFADWHVWHLAWTVLQGGYRDVVLDKARERAQARAAETKRHRPPSPKEVVARRLAGAIDMPEIETIHSAKALDAFRQAKYRPEASTLIVSGKFDVEEMRKEVDSLFGGWRPRAAVAGAAPNQPRVQNAIGIADDDATTAEISIAFAPAALPAASEIAARAVLDEMLDARLRIVREGLGASYGVYSTLTPSAIWVTGAVEPAYAAEAAKAMADELERFRTGDASLIDDFVRARKRVLANLLALPLGASRRADALERVVTRGGDVKHLEGALETTRTLAFAAVQRIAARDMRPERMITAVRGKKASVEAALGALGVARDKIEWLAPAKAKGSDQRAPAEAPKLTMRAGSTPTATP